MNESFKGGRSILQYGTVKDEKIYLYWFGIEIIPVSMAFIFCKIRGKNGSSK